MIIILSIIVIIVAIWGIYDACRKGGKGNLQRILGIVFACLGLIGVVIGIYVSEKSDKEIYDLVQKIKAIK